jgi:hypothetical protein
MAARENRKIRKTTIGRSVQDEKEQGEKEARERAGEKSKGENGKRNYEFHVRSEAFITYSGASSRVLGREIS